MMPRLDGYSACRELRAHFRTRHIPIVMLTAKGADDDKLTGLEGGANDYVTKPWQSKELVQRVKNHLEWSKNQRAVNPLTGLPGNLSILAERQKRYDAGTPFAQIFLDLDNFKAFNDRYGFPVGDTAIRAVAEALVDVVETQGESGDFVGHIGGDDFIMLTEPEPRRDPGRGGQGDDRRARAAALRPPGPHAGLRARAQPPPRARGLPAHERDHGAARTATRRPACTWPSSTTSSPSSSSTARASPARSS